MSCSMMLLKNILLCKGAVQKLGNYHRGEGVEDFVTDILWEDESTLWNSYITADTQF